MNAEGVALLKHAFEKHMVAKRQVMDFRVALSMDETMKRALKENVASVAVIEREIARIAAETLVAFKRDVVNMIEESYKQEMTRKVEAGRLLEAKLIAPHRHDMLVAAIAKATDQIVSETEAIVDRIIVNLARRFDAAVSPRN